MTERIQNFKNKDRYTVSDIAELVEILRGEGGCAWDREQTHESIRNAMIEETYEFIEGLDAKDDELMEEELGDVIFQVFFHARIADERGSFDIDDIADGICKKMVLRHPHVFGDVTVANSAEVLKRRSVYFGCNIFEAHFRGRNKARNKCHYYTYYKCSNDGRNLLGVAHGKEEYQNDRDCNQRHT